MANTVIYGFIAMMWGLILAGGGILVLLVSKITVQGYGDHMDFLIASAIKAAIAIILVILWVFVLTKLKNKIFEKQINP